MRRSISGAFVLTASAVLLASWAALTVSRNRLPDLASATALAREPRIDPDYTSLTIPPNIAPLNFRIVEEGRDFLVRFTSDGGESLDVRCRDGNCRIPASGWRRLLEANKGGRLFYDIFAQERDGRWVRFRQVANSVAREPIDSHIVYRLLEPNKNRSRIHGIFQRDIESFRKSALMTRRNETFTCFNCHTFNQNDPNKFLVHVRGDLEGMVLVTDGKIRKIDTRQEPMFRPIAYAAWHPDGRHIAGTCNRFIGHHPENARTYYFQALEKRGDLVVYDVEQNTLGTTEGVFGSEYIETHPCWSADGKYIYYSRGKEVPINVPEDWEKSEFDLMRVAYDVTDGTWGSPETVKAYSEIGMSCAFPRPSPCGKYVLQILSDKTTYPIHQKDSDVYLLNLDSLEHEKLDAVCSDRAESYPRWSSNGRWFSFVSNRRDGLCAIPYFAYFDTDGKVHKAFVLPQEDPEYYDTFIDTYNTVELVKSRVNVSTFKLAQAMQEPSKAAKFLNPPEVDAYTGPTKPD